MVVRVPARRLLRRAATGREPTNAEVLPVDHDVASAYAAILLDLRARGTPIPTNDVWIAATASRAGAPVVTFDAHLARVPGVGCILL